jgi:hypothetical protein
MGLLRVHSIFVVTSVRRWTCVEVLRLRQDDKWESCLGCALEEGGCALASAYAHSDDSVAGFAARHFVG